MKKVLTVIALLFCLHQFADAQAISHFDIDLGLIQNHKGFFKLYDGILEVGGNYHIGISRNLFAGVAMHAGFLNRKNTSAHTVFYKPAGQAAYSIHFSERIALIPVISAGYSWFTLRNDPYDFKDTQSGVNMGFDLRLLWKTQERTDFYFFGSYDYIFLDEDKAFTELYYYRNIYHTSIGLGISIK